MRFRRVVIQNFQSIARADLRLGEITVIVGPSNTGKSSVVRALESWAENSSDSVIHTVGTLVTRVAVAIDRQHKVVWERQDSVAGAKAIGGRMSRYVHADKSREGPPISYEKIGRTCPQEIVDVTGIRAIKFDDDLALWLNFAPQDDPWFLLGKAWGPTKVARVIGKVSGIDSLVMAIKDVKRLRTISIEAARKTEQTLEELHGSLKRLAWVDRAQDAVVEVVDPLKALENDWARLGKAEDLLRTVGRLRASQKEAAAYIKPAQAVVEHVESTGFMDDLERLKEAETLWAQIQERQGKAAVLSGEIKSVAAELKKLEQQWGAATQGDLTCPLCGQPAHAECRANLAAEQS